MIRVYIDSEFDAVRYQRKFEQAVISIGAVACDDQNKELGRFYTLVCPRYFRRLSPIVKKITKLNNEDILSACKLYKVVGQFNDWIDSFLEQDDVRFYSCGPDDRRTLIRNCEIHKIENHYFDRIEDVQKVVSATVKFQNRVISPALSLDDMKAVYGVDGIVEHNALTDAFDLMYIHQRFIANEPQKEDKIIEIVNRKEQKLIESRKKQMERLRKFIKTQFESYPSEYVFIPLFPEVIKEFQQWEMREKAAYIHWRDDDYLLDDGIYPYTKIRIWMKLDLDDEIPSVYLRFVHNEKDVVKKYSLNYRNATMVEKILKRALA